ncbi:MAG TPA: TRAP transporter substrate-binding protein [Dehalococcoidia bacterium]|nr:TRAP transporter substrate-binding protein [Dehalococcoidia bacterium]
MRRKKLIVAIGSIFLALTIACMACVSACAPAAKTITETATVTPEPEYKWRFGTPWTQKTRNESIALFCDLIYVYSNGRIKVDFYPDGLLGSHTEIFHAMQEGTIEMGVFAPYVDIVPGGMLNWMNWTVETYEEAALAYSPPDGILYKVMDKAWEEVGGKLLWSSYFGPYGLGSNVRPLITPDDLRGQKMRVSASLGYVRCMENMGKGTGLTLHTIPWAELYSALERGVVDMCWSLWPSLVEERHYEVLKYYTALGFGWDAGNIVMNRELWNGLPPDLQDAIMRAAKDAELRDAEAHRRVNTEYKHFLAEAGLQIYYPTAEERAVWRERANMPAIWEELCTPWLEKHYPGQNMTQKILDELDRIKAYVAAAGG